jgi:hypothetical protein
MLTSNLELNLRIKDSKNEFIIVYNLFHFCGKSPQGSLFVLLFILMARFTAREGWVFCFFSATYAKRTEQS